MQTKVFEVVFGNAGAEVYWTVLAVLIDTRDSTTDEMEVIEWTGKKDMIGMMRVDNGALVNPTFSFDPAKWSDTAVKMLHMFLVDNFKRLASGVTIDWLHDIQKTTKVRRLSQRGVMRLVAGAKTRK